MHDGGIKKSSRRAYCYVLIGYKADTMESAEKRLREAWAAGFFPYAMLYRDESGETDPDWRKFQRLWVRPQLIYHQLKKGDNNG